MRTLTAILLMILVGFIANAASADDAKPAVGFKLHRIDDYRGEACGVGDFNKDGKLDIVALPFLYLAPEFKPTKICEIAGEVDEEGKGYRDDFMNGPLDVDVDGWLDVITVSWFAKKAEWLRNPGADGGLWLLNLIAEAGNFEAGSLADVDADGKVDYLLPDTQDTALDADGDQDIIVTDKWGGPAWLENMLKTEDFSVSFPVDHGVER